MNSIVTLIGDLELSKVDTIMELVKVELQQKNKKDFQLIVEHSIRIEHNLAMTKQGEDEISKTNVIVDLTSDFAIINTIKAKIDKHQKLILNVV